MAFPVFDTLDAVPELFRADYEERDGKFHPKLEDTSALKNAHERQKQENAKLKDKLTKLEQDLDGLKRTADPKAEDLRKQIADEVEKVRTQLGAENATLKAQLAKRDVWSAAMKVMEHHGVMPSMFEPLLKLEGDRLELVDGKLLVKDDPATSIDKLFGDVFKKTYPTFYDAKMKPGPDADGGSGGALRGAEWDKLSPEEKLTRARSSKT